MEERFFTVEQANAALAKVRPLAEAMVESRRRLGEMASHAAALRRRIAGNGAGISPIELAQAEERAAREAGKIAQLLDRITALGAQVKDLDQGLVDFPARRGDETVLLCWHVGEDEIAHWHGLEDGFAGRKPIDQL